MLDINIIEPNRNQPRKQFDDEGIEELADSIRKYGLIQPLLVQKKGDYYEIIAGERRWRASKEADLKKVPVIIKDYSDSEALKVSLIENLQRENLNAIEEAQAYQILKKEYGLKQDEIASSVSKSRAAITNTMRLLKLDERIQNLIVEDQITSGHGRALLAIADKEVQYKAALKIRDDNLSVREAGLRTITGKYAADIGIIPCTSAYSDIAVFQVPGIVQTGRRIVCQSADTAHSNIGGFGILQKRTCIAVIVIRISGEGVGPVRKAHKATHSDIFSCGSGIGEAGLILTGDKGTL